jgi:predicted Fe-Mo cluster-binding NifX family protein
MRVGVPVWNDRVAPVMDESARLLVVDVENGQERGRLEHELSAAYPAQRARQLAGLGIHVLICGGISRPLANVLETYGISLFPWTAGPISEVLAAYLSGRLLEPRWRMPGCRWRAHRFRDNRRSRRWDGSG